MRLGIACIILTNSKVRDQRVRVLFLTVNVMTKVYRHFKLTLNLSSLAPRDVKGNISWSKKVDLAYSS